MCGRLRRLVIFRITPPVPGDQKLGKGCLPNKDIVGRSPWNRLEGAPSREHAHDPTQHSVRQDSGDFDWFGLLLVCDRCAAYVDAGGKLLSRRVQELATAAVLVHGRRNGHHALCERAARSEERRVGKECRSRWSPY